MQRTTTKAGILVAVDRDLLIPTEELAADRETDIAAGQTIVVMDSVGMMLTDQLVLLPLAVEGEGLPTDTMDEDVLVLPMAGEVPVRSCRNPMMNCHFLVALLTRFLTFKSLPRSHNTKSKSSFLPPLVTNGEMLTSHLQSISGIH